MYQDLAILALFILVYSSVAGRVERTWVSGPIVFTIFGLLIGPVGLDLLSFKTDGETLRTLAELTLAMVLFTDAADADMGVLRKTEALPTRLLLIGLPLTILLGFGVGVLLFERLSLFVRQGLNVESGLNDGICVPILFVFLALATGKAGEGGPWKLAMMLVAEEIGIGLAVGLVLTTMAGLLLKFAKGQQWLTHTWIQVPVVALALGCFAVAQFLGGSGFIAAFTGGLLFGVLAKQHREEFLRAAEGTGDTLALITWVIFGSAVVGQAVGHFSWLILLYAVLSLTLIRILPVFLVLTGTGVSTEGKLFMGWFGPRGLASIVFGVIVVNANLPNSGSIAMIVVCTIMLSILGHGITANPWAKAFGARRRLAEGSAPVSE
jgi:NhaP-type Na+/H+ or K+/H+ antiporter